MSRHPAATDDATSPSIPKSVSLDEDGLHKTLPVDLWWPLIEKMANSDLPLPQWPDIYQDMVRMTLRFTRPDGSTTFEPTGLNPDRIALLRRLDDPGLTTISRWWSTSRAKTGESGPPPLPAYGTLKRPIAMLRADWAKEGDYLAVDARDPTHHKFELTIGGRPLLGPDWPGASGRAKMTFWKSSHLADCAEWSCGAGASRITRTAVFLRGRKLALIAEQRASGESPMQVSLADRVEAKPLAESRTISLKAANGPSARVIPIGLVDSIGSLVTEGGAISLNSPSETLRRWLPLLVSWDSDRNRQAMKWRILTVTENTKACKPGVAFAARIAWGFGDHFVIYRSLGRPAMRTFLGHQTSVRFLIGMFNEKGDVMPLLQVD